MIKKEEEKRKAIAMRKKGKTYSEILSVIPVAKSTLTLWLHNVGMAIHQKQRITDARIAGQKRGALAKHNIRVALQKKIINAAKSEIGSISKRELFLMGVILYWAEGSKEKEWYPGSRLIFSNMDPNMIRVFLKWLTDIAKVPKNMIGFQIYFHKDHKRRVEEVITYWQKVTGFPRESLEKVYFKTNKIKTTNRRNIGDQYYGLLRIIVGRSSGLVRKVAGWTEGIVEGM